jgi:hypothetical protein
MDSSPITLPAAAPGSARASLSEADIDQLPQHARPSRIKVTELAEGQRKRAESTASQLTADFEDVHISDAIARISRVCNESHIRAKRGDRTGWAVLQVEKRQQRETMPADTRANKPSRALPRVAVSAPVMVKDALLRPVPGSPMGNAWSGEHYWSPEFSESTPGSPMWEEVGCAHSDAAHQKMYDSVVADVEKCSVEVKTEAAQNDEQMPDVECDVVAAMTVLEEINAAFVENGLPAPKEIFAKAEEFAEDEKNALDQNPIRGPADIRESDLWLNFEHTSLQPLTKLDEVHGRLKMIKETRRNSVLEPSERAYRLVYAVQILQVKTRILKAQDGYEDSDDEMVEYGKFLRSLAEVLPVKGGNGSSMVRDAIDSELERRKNTRMDVLESGLQRRRLRGKAPSTLDLEAWASKMKDMDEKKRKEVDEFFQESSVRSGGPIQRQ